MDLIAVVAGPGDRRVKKLVLTDRGRGLEAELTGTQMRHLSDAFDKAGRISEGRWIGVMEALADIEG
jgi:DNA-binding MarR family transcriptional regulator